MANHSFNDSLIYLPDAESLIEALATTAPGISIRPNPQKKVDLQFSPDTYVKWWPSAYFLSERPKFTLMPELHAGAFYVQDSSSMFSGFLLKKLLEAMGDHDPIVCLDACASPGGKSTLALDILPENSTLVSNEFDRRRANILAENISKWGASNAIVTNEDANRFGRLANTFDIIMLDAPCSGEGMMRKDEFAAEQWSPSLVSSCAQTQRELAESLWEALRPGGFMIYSTCTFNPSENESIVRHILTLDGARCFDIDLSEVADEILVGSLDGKAPELQIFRFIPGKTRGEGQTLAVILKEPGNDSPTGRPAKKQKGGPTTSNSQPIFGLNGTPLYSHGDSIFALTGARSIEILDKLRSLKADIIQTGTPVATNNGKVLQPSHQLSLATSLKPDFAHEELSLDEALKYLRGEAITLSDGTPKGFVIVTYHGLPLGFVKNIGSRANNLYPKEWRIRIK